VNPLRKFCGIPLLLPLVIAAALALTYAHFFATRTEFIWRMKQEAARDHYLARVPIPIQDTTISGAPGTTVTSFGYEFELPWPAEVNVSEDIRAVALSQSEEKAVAFMNPTKFRGPLNDLRQRAKEGGEDLRILEYLFGAQSDYYLERSTLYATPDQLSFIFPGRKKALAALWLSFKQIREKEAETGLYSFKTGQLRGFQFGDPRRAKSIVVEAFDDQDRKLEFVFSNKFPTNLTITQAEINRVLQTFHPAPATPQ
jgi:hypothetical protein